jgi:predicted enzyme related to lactoylglutathione lyase
VEQEQRCQALLAVERTQRAVLDVAVDEVESDVSNFSECFVQDIEEALADVGRPNVGASLGVVRWMRGSRCSSPSCRDRLGILLVLSADATSGRDRKVAYVANFVSGVTIDCVDPQRVARFWSALLGREPGPSQAGWVYLGHRGDPQPRLVFQPVPEPKAGKVRIHLDVTVDDVDEAIELVTSLGGRTTDERHDYDEGVVVVMADPEGHEFCLVQYY